MMESRPGSMFHIPTVMTNTTSINRIEVNAIVTKAEWKSTENSYAKLSFTFPSSTFLPAARACKKTKRISGETIYHGIIELVLSKSVHHRLSETRGLLGTIRQSGDRLVARKELIQLENVYDCDVSISTGNRKMNYNARVPTTTVNHQM